jgi:hypothetical protein
MLGSFRKIPIHSARMILAAFNIGIAPHDMISLACLLELVPASLFDKKHESPISIAKLYKELSDMHGRCLNRTEVDNLIKVLIGCDFLEVLVAFQRFTAIYKEHGRSRAIAWCEGNGVNFREFMKVLSSIDEVLWSVSEVGIDPFHSTIDINLYQAIVNSVEVNTDESFSEMVDIVDMYKQCIYEGYKTNLAKWNPERNCYISRYGYAITEVPSSVKAIKGSKYSKFKQTRPNTIIYTGLTLKAGLEDTLERSASYCSSMDGRKVGLDCEFVNS